MKFKALKDINLPKHKINVKKGKAFQLTEEQLNDVCIFENIWFETTDSEKKEDNKKVDVKVK